MPPTRMSAHRVSAALRRARSRSRNYHSMRRFDRDIKPTSQACSPAISGDACAESARKRRSRGHPAQTRRRCRRSAGKDREGNRRLVPTPLPGIAPACQSCSSERRNSRCHGGNTRLDPPRRVRHCQKMLRRRSTRRQKSKAFFMFSLQDLSAASRGRVKLGHPVPLSNLSKDAKSGSPETTST